MKEKIFIPSFRRKQANNPERGKTFPGYFYAQRVGIGLSSENSCGSRASTGQRSWYI